MHRYHPRGYDPRRRSKEEKPSSSTVCPRDCVVHQDDWMERPSSKGWAKELDARHFPPLSEGGERSRLKSEIDINNAEIATLLERVELLKSENLRRLVQLSPIRHVPPEIMSRIFLEFRRNGALSRESTPALWSRMFVADSYLFPERGWSSLFQRWMDRVKQAPLDLVIQASRNTKAVFDPFLTTQHNWRSLDLHTIKYSEIIDLFNTAESFPRLTELRLATTDGTGNPVHNFIMAHQGEPGANLPFAPTPSHPIRLPNLRSLSLSGRLIRDLSYFRAPRLKVLTLKGFELSAASMRYLEKFPNLRELIIQHTKLLPENANPSCKRLKYFTYVLGTGAQLDLDFLRSCQSLTKVVIDSSNAPIQMSGQASFPSVVHFEYRISSKLDAASASAVLAAFPNVAILTLSPRSDSAFNTGRPTLVASVSGWLAALCLPADGAPPVCPAVTKLVLKKCKPRDAELCLLSSQRSPIEQLAADDDKVVRERREADPRYRDWDPKLLITLLDCPGYPKLEDAGLIKIKEHISSRPAPIQGPRLPYPPLLGAPAVQAVQNLLNDLQQFLPPHLQQQLPPLQLQQQQPPPQQQPGAPPVVAGQQQGGLQAPQVAAGGEQQVQPIEPGQQQGGQQAQQGGPAPVPGGVQLAALGAHQIGAGLLGLLQHQMGAGQQQGLQAQQVPQNGAVQPQGAPGQQPGLPGLVGQQIAAGQHQGGFHVHQAQLLPQNGQQQQGGGAQQGQQPQPGVVVQQIVPVDADVVANGNQLFPQPWANLLGLPDDDFDDLELHWDGSIYDLDGHVAWF